jgi:putative membrane-bound dehydrogenase-like protein
MTRAPLLAAGLVLAGILAVPADEPRPIKILFLGDNGHHRPAERFRQLQPVLARRGIDMTYTDRADALNPKVLAGYDGLVIYANTTRITPEQEKALLDFVEGGKGFIPLHCASYCFLNSPKYVELVGAQFLRHGTGTFRTTVAVPDHPVMRGFAGFESWDETYVHTRHNDRDRTVLEYRVEGDRKEPWTWVRTQGKGRVFYTAWGHDERTWGNPGFQDLVERGIRWAVGREVIVRAPEPTNPFDAPFPVPETTPPRKDVRPFEYADVGKKIPNYTPGRQWGAQGEPLSKMQRPLPPDESIKHLVTPRGFHAELFASEQDWGGGKPMCMTWDERGRLWLALTVDYPNNLQAPGEGHDRIVVCEDTDGDGRCDKVTVFADHLSVPSSMAFSQGGLIVYSAGQTLFLADTDGDGKADVRRVLFGTWSLPDTHGGPSNMQYGLDNWVWGMQGYNYSRLRLGGETVAFRQGFYRFRPDASKMEFLRSTNNNTWGLGISEEGIVFGSTANGNPSVYLPIPNRYYEAVRGWAPSLELRGIADSYSYKPITTRVRQVDWHGGYTAAAGHALYTARAYPKEYWNRTAFVSDPTGHLTGTFVLRREGSNFHSNNSFNLLASDDEWTAPVMAEVGPDGNVWVIDWYAFIVQHNPTPVGFKTGRGAAYETDLRDTKHGRVYRVVYGPAKAKKPAFSLAGATPEKLVAALKNDNLFWRRHAQRLLVESGKTDVLPALVGLARGSSVDEIGLNVGAIHALWTMHGLGALDGSHPEATAAAVAALQHPSAGVRRNAVQVLPRAEASVAAVLGARLPEDPDPQVRLLALLALADQPPTAAAGRAVAAALADPANAADRWVPDAATCAAAKNSESFLEAVASSKAPPAKLAEVTAVVAEHYARGVPADSVGVVLAGLAGADPAVLGAAVTGLAKGWGDGRPPRLDAALERDLERVLGRLPPGRRGVLIRLATGWGSKKFETHAARAAGALLARVKDPSLGTADRVAAAHELIGYRGSDRETVTAVLDQVTPATAPDLAAGLLDALRGSESRETGRLLLDRLGGLTPSARAAALGAMLGRSEWTRALLDAADKGEVRLSDLSLDQRQALSEHPDRVVRERTRALLRRGGDLPNPDRQKVLDELLPITREKGDAALGKVVFQKNCAKCHVHGTEGNRIGPDLTGMAVHPKEHLLTDVIDPSRSVEANYRAYTVSTNKGKVLVGLLASESKTAIELFDAEGKKQTVLRSDIDELQASAKSLMPDGFEKQLSRKELADLLEFLTARGKYLPLPLTKAATVVSTRGMFYSEESRGERLVFDDWGPKTFEGVPFNLVDPQGDRVPNVVLLYGPQGAIPPKMPRRVELPLNAPAKAIHVLGGVSGWGFPYGPKGTVSLIVRLHYADGKAEDHPLTNGVEFADYIRRVDVPGSKFAFGLRGGRQVRYLAVRPGRTEPIRVIELVKGPDETAPVIVAVTAEGPE